MPRRFEPTISCLTWESFPHMLTGSSTKNLSRLQAPHVALHLIHARRSMMAQQNALDRYKIIRELGRGAIGTVYAARDRSTGVVVALKTLDPALFGESDANLAELFLKSACSARHLRHRNIVRIHDAGEVDGTVYVAMELLVGESLRNMLDNRPVSIARAIQVFDDITSALAYAHEEGIVHRGVRPSNIMVLRSGVAKIGDFGIGQIGEAARRYMSPDQVRGGPVDHRSDLFSLGALFYEMLTRRALFEGNSPQEIMENILHAEPPLPSAVNPHVPSALDGIIGSLLAGHPDERVADARILLRDLQRREPKLRTPAAHQSRDREAPHESSCRHAVRPSRRRPNLQPNANPACGRPTRTHSATTRRCRMPFGSTSTMQGPQWTADRCRNALPDLAQQAWRHSASCSQCLDLPSSRITRQAPASHAPPRTACGEAKGNPRLRPLRRRHHRRAQWAMRERSKSHWASHPRRTRCRRNRSWRNPALRQELRACRPASLSNPQQPALRPRKRRRGHHNRGRKSRSRSLAHREAHHRGIAARRALH